MVSKVDSVTYATTTYSYNLANMVVSMTNDPSNDTVQTFAYTYYLDGNQRTKTEGTKVTTYAYDYAGRLVSEVTTDNGIPSVGYTYTYDDFGNRLTMTTDGVTTNYTYDLNNRLLQTTAGNNTTTYSYNANGDMLTEIKKESGVVKEHAIYTYDLFFGQLVSVMSMNNSIGGSYDYYVSGLRKKSGNTYLIYDGQNIAAEYDGAKDKMIAVYNRGVNLISRYEKATYNYYVYTFNAHGDVTGLVGLLNINLPTFSVGRFNKTYDYDAFGNEVFPDPDDANPFRYCGEYYDKGTNRLYLRARDYDSATGRFTSEDTHWNPDNTIYGDNPLKIGDKLVPNQTAFMQSLNRYTYCMSNPIMYVDQSGEIGTPISWALAVIAGVAGGIFGNYLADKFNLSGWKRVAVIAGVAIGGAAIGFLAGEILVGFVMSFLYANPAVMISLPTTVLSLLGINGDNLAVLGRSFEGVGYVNLARQIGACFFSIPDAIWKSLSPDQQWAANVEFLNNMIAQGKDFLLSNNAYDALKNAPNSAFAQEILYLLQQGYVIVENGWKMVMGG